MCFFTYFNYNGFQVERAGLDSAVQATPEALPRPEVGDTLMTGKEFDQYLQPEE